MKSSGVCLQKLTECPSEYCPSFIDRMLMTSMDDLVAMVRERGYEFSYKEDDVIGISCFAWKDGNVVEVVGENRLEAVRRLIEKLRIVEGEK